MPPLAAPLGCALRIAPLGCALRIALTRCPPPKSLTPRRYVKYNVNLRGFGAALDGCKGNKYVTTTHVINSVIVKASKLTKVAKVYRGVAGVLPDRFCEDDAHGFRGGVE